METETAVVIKKKGMVKKDFNWSGIYMKNKRALQQQGSFFNITV
jgi:hypothetical protein